MRIPGKINGQILCGRVKRRKESDTASVKHNSADNIIHGMPDVEVELFGSFEKLAETKVKNNIVEIHWKNFPPGSVLILDVSLPGMLYSKLLLMLLYSQTLQMSHKQQSPNSPNLSLITR